MDDTTSETTQIFKPCKECNGLGNYQDFYCEHCDGRGFINATEDK